MKKLDVYRSKVWQRLLCKVRKIFAKTKNPAGSPFPKTTTRFTKDDDALREKGKNEYK